jgi:pyrimidine-nucleoside phosphorylase
MRKSGDYFTWTKPYVADKHSTGGVGDKTSLILLPLCILEGLTVPMIAGRGLGHTGGTLDKLEAIPGMQVFLPKAKAQSIIETLGGAIIGQTESIAPLDRKLYALRDVTATVESIPLITASILSKKLSEGIGSLVMDVKFGSGAFMQSKDDAEALAKSIYAVATECGVQTACYLTDMNSPLGDRAGNTLELLEVIEILKGELVNDTLELSLELAAAMIRLAKPNVQDPRPLLQQHLKSGAAFELFKRIVAAQGGDVSYLDQPSKFEIASCEKSIVADQDGYIESIDVRSLGVAIIELGGGRRVSSDAIDFGVGLKNLKRAGTKVNRGDVIATIVARSKEQLTQVENRLRTAFKISENPPTESPLIWKKLGA